MRLSAMNKQMTKTVGFVERANLLKKKERKK